jgi:amino acid adenylation domain-containing protein
MTLSKRLGVPADRALVSAAAGRRTDSLSLEIERPASETVAAACLVVFARINQPGLMAVKLDESYVSSPIDPQATLQQLTSSMSVGTAEAEVEWLLDLEVRSAANQSAPAEEPRGGMTLRFVADDTRLMLMLDSRRERVSDLTARDLLEKIALVIEAIGRRPATRIADVSLMTPSARSVIPDPAQPIEARAFVPVHERFLEVARRHAQDPAIRHGGRIYSYGDLRRQSLHLAERLVAAGVCIGDVVIVSGRSSFGLIASTIAILIAGGVLVTVDEALPADRRKQIAGLTEARCRLSVQTDSDVTCEEADSTLNVAAWPSHASLDGLADHDWQGPAVPPDANAYIFFTSGSTGTPKGVLGVHRGLAHFLDWQRDNFTIGPGDRSAQLTALSFDVVLRDIFFPLTGGAAICIPDRELILDARRMLAWIREQNVTILHCVPSLMKAWLLADDGARPFDSLKYIFFAGEPLTDTLIRRFKAAASSSIRITNLYGPTETTLAKMANIVDEPEPGVQPVGRPQPGVDVFIVRDRKTFCGLWETGEIAIRTPYRSHGYFRNEELTRQVFIENPARRDPQDLIYYTGDLGRYRADGKVEIFGRIDAQVKIRGVRIEPNEIEAQFLAFPGIRDAAVSVRPGPGDEKVLYGFVVRSTVAEAVDDRSHAGEIREYLRGKLHEAMVPARLVFLDGLPYLPNGKLNRKELANIDVGDAADGAGEIALALDDAARPIIDALRRLVPVPIDDLGRSFIELGGDSLSFVTATLVIERELGYVPERWEQQPLQRLVDARRAAAQPPVPVADAASKNAGERPRHPGLGPSSLWAAVEIPILIRALAILLVVAGHADADTAVTATNTLFLISGVSFARFLLPGIDATGDLGPTFRFIAKFGIPAGLWMLATAVKYKHFWIPDLLLAGTMFQDPDSPHFTFWYLDILAASVLLLAVFAKIRHLRRRRAAVAGRNPAASEGMQRNSFNWALAIVLLSLVAAAVQTGSGFWDGRLGMDSVGPFKWFWLVALGVLTAEADSGVRKALVVALVALAAVLAYGANLLVELNVFFFVSFLLLIFVRRVFIPRFLLHPVIVIASSTLFVYIVNYTVIHQMQIHGLSDWMTVQVGAAVLVGIALTRVWDWAGIQTKRARTALLRRSADRAEPP